MNPDLITYRAWIQTFSGGPARPVPHTVSATCPKEAAETVASEYGAPLLILIQRAYSTQRTRVHPISLFKAERRISVVPA
jgi:hypothetical protein